MPLTHTYMVFLTRRFSRRPEEPQKMSQKAGGVKVICRNNCILTFLLIVVGTIKYTVLAAGYRSTLVNLEIERLYAYTKIRSRTATNVILYTSNYLSRNGGNKFII